MFSVCSHPPALDECNRLAQRPFKFCRVQMPSKTLKPDQTISYKLIRVDAPLLFPGAVLEVAYAHS